RPSLPSADLADGPLWRPQTIRSTRHDSWLAPRRSVMSLCRSRIRGLGLPHALCPSQTDGVTGQFADNETPVWGKYKCRKLKETGSVAGHYQLLRNLLRALSSSECPRGCCGQCVRNRPLVDL